MTFTVAPRTGWTVGYFDPEDRCVYYIQSNVILPTPQAVLDHVMSDAGKTLQLGPAGLVFMHVRRTSRKAENHYFHSLAAANRFHQSLSR